MKYIAHICLLSVSFNAVGQNMAEGKFKIVSIDTIAYYYVIKASNPDNDNVSILLSPKNAKSVATVDCPIKTDSTYCFELEPTRILKYSDKKDDQVILPLRNFYSDGILISTHKELPFLSKNLQGLNYIKKECIPKK
jgi:hypothetical protein